MSTNISGGSEEVCSQLAATSGEKSKTARNTFQSLADFVSRSRRLFVLTGAGCSTESGIPDYRDAEGVWKTKPPMRFHTFVGSELAQRRYWARAMMGWARIRDATPNAGHRALARLEGARRVACVVTQNVDGLHQRAGSRNVIDLHGRLDTVRCLDCGNRSSRALHQERLRALNPDWAEVPFFDAPDGDARLAPER